jgi:hypothetical protein
VETSKRRNRKTMSNNKQNKVRKMFKKIFNTNTGYFIKTIVYFYKENSSIGYVLCKGYLMFGIPGYDVVNIYTDEAEAKEAQAKLKGN